MNKIIKTLAGLSLAAVFVAILAIPTAEVMAQTFGTPYQPLTTIPGITQKGTPTNPVEIIKGIYGLAIGVGSVIATIMLIWAGFEYMYEESITGKSHARERIMNAFIGLLVILGSYILLRTINPDLVDFNITLQGGSTRIKNLIAVQEEFDKATQKIREAQTDANRLREGVKKAEEDITLAGKEIDRLNATITATSTPAQKESIDKQVAELNAKIESLKKDRDSMALDEKYIRATGGLDLNTKAMEESLLTDGGNNISGNIKRALDDITEARAALKAANASSTSPAVAAKLAELEIQEVLFRARAAQLNTINRFQNNLIEKKEDAAAEIRSVGNKAITTFTKSGRPELVKTIDEETLRRIKTVCPKCSR